MIINEIDEGIENNYTLLGVTGVEDLLQDNVGSCIKDFITADIKVWMLTGDKGATAKQIGMTCGIVEQDMDIYEITENINIEKELINIA